MPSLRSLLPRHTTSEGTLSPKSPKSPRSPKPPRPLTFTERNPDYLNQCLGCNNVEDLIRWNIEHQKDGKNLVQSALLHNSFHELEQCAEECELCRVFRQSILLQEVTFDGARKFQDTQGKVIVRWEEANAIDGKPGAFLRVEIQDWPGYSGVVNCNSRNEVAHLALPPDGRANTVIEQAKRWMNDCLDNHIGHCDNLKFSSKSPQLLIEILSPEFIRLRESQSSDYVALSYCWGNPRTQTERDEIKLGKTFTTNLDQRREPFRIDGLPTTVRDALYILHAMGIRYAWIDTLCVLQDKPEGVATMDKVYANALFTLCACATTRATAKLLDQREAWTQKTEPCRLGGQWLTTPDMSLNELRLRSPLVERAWTLQEEILSPRILYVSSSRFYWSCARGHEIELKPTYEQKATKLQRPVYAASDRNKKMQISQAFLLACFFGEYDLHAFWIDIVKSYALRNMSDRKDRLRALSGIAARYLTANSPDEYLAGIWASNLPEGLVWKVNKAVDTAHSQVDLTASEWPSWSWAALPLQTSIETDAKSARSSFFQRTVDDKFNMSGRFDVENVVKQGEHIKEICVTGRARALWKSSSRRVEWSSVSRLVEGEEKFTFASHPEQDIHTMDSVSGRILVYEQRRKEVVGQLDFRLDIRRVETDQVQLMALEIGETTMLLLESCGDGTHRRLGVVWNVRKDFFASTEPEIFILR